jgi:hypothetical protein
MRLTEIARGNLRVKDGAKSLTIRRSASEGVRVPDFVLYQNSIEKWDAPNDQEDITPAEKDQLIQFLKDEFSRRKMFLEIE